MLDDNNPLFQYAIALTGGIATGKSTVASLLKLHGFLTIDADTIAHTLLDLHHHKIAKLFGDEFVSEQKVLRKKLGGLVFYDPEQKRRLEKFLHPLIKEEISYQARHFEIQKKPYFIDIPLFFETNNYSIEKVLVVYADKPTQIQRLIKRDNCTHAEAVTKINNQMDIEQKKQKATLLIDNTKDLKHLQKEVESIIKELKCL